MIETWSRGAADDHMNQSILVDLARLVERHPWWRARALLTIALLRKLGVKPGAQVLDAGCGWGVTLSALERAGYETVGLDVSRGALERLDRTGRHLVEADLSQTMVDSSTQFDVVLALDVIEHLDDDTAALANLSRLLRPGGLMIVSVPALPEMYTEFDAVQGHRRRYTPERLGLAFDQSDVAVEQIFWWGQWLQRRLQASRTASRARPGDQAADVYRRYLELPPWPLPVAARMMFALEQGRAVAGKLRQGSSLFAVARRTSTRLARNASPRVNLSA